MKRKFAIFNLVLMAVVLLTTAYQSFHAFSHEHFAAQLHSHELKTDNNGSVSVIKAAHGHDDCSVCDFHFDFFTAPQQFCLRLYFPFKAIPYSFNSVEGNASFSGSLFALRAPPVLV